MLFSISALSSPGLCRSHTRIVIINTHMTYRDNKQQQLKELTGSEREGGPSPLRLLWRL